MKIARVDDTSELKRWIMSYDRDAEALGPEELRARVEEEVEERRK